MRTTLVIALLAAVAAGCGSAPAEPGIQSPCLPPAAPDTGTAQGWIGWIAQHPGDVSLVIDDGRGERLAYREADPAPTASASKVLHLASYARAVAEGRLNPDEPVPVGDWEAWYLPGTDGGAHPAALDSLEVAHDGVRALDPQRTVRLDDMVATMIRVSDNAVPDFLRQRLGDDALRRAGADAGWPAAELPSFLGQVIALLAPELLERNGEWALAQRYATDPALRADLNARPLPAPEVQADWAEGTGSASAAQLTAIHRAISTGSFGPGAELARSHLEWQPPPPGVLGLGFKGGSLPGVLTEAMTLRRTDGSTASAVLLVRRMPLPDWQRARESYAHQELLITAMSDQGVTERVRCALRVSH